MHLANMSEMDEQIKGPHWRWIEKGLYLVMLGFYPEGRRNINQEEENAL